LRNPLGTWWENIENKEKKTKYPSPLQKENTINPS
jgi:hypothetical protein